ncbi:MAG: hypothetical protein QXN36_00715 [Candidatus Bathyarchaeia archaeon]
MGLYESLTESFPLEETVFGSCLLIPHALFKPEWNEQLSKEGVKVFQQAYNGKLFFFLKKSDGNGAVKSPEEPKRQELKPIVWNEETLRLVEKFRREGLSYYKIAAKMEEFGFKVAHTTIMKKLKRRMAHSQSLNVQCEGDGLFREFLEALEILYPKYRKACAVLLREASKVLENSP